MQLDLQRWNNLQQELRALKAQSEGLATAIFQMDSTRSQARAALAQLQDEAARVRPTQEIGDAAAHAISEADGSVNRVTEELSGLERQHGILHQRVNALKAIARACRDWAHANDVVLDPDDVRPPMVSFQPAPPGARQFGAGQDAGPPPLVREPYPGGPPSARQVPSLGST